MLIDHKCRPFDILTDVFLYRYCCGCWSMLSLVSINAHTRSLSFCLSVTLLSFPFFPFHIKNPLADYFGINWNTDFNVLACSHFKGNINMKIVIVTQRLQKIPISTVLWLIEYFMLFFAFKVKNYFILMHEISSEMT